jgi:hypothetical protein
MATLSTMYRFGRLPFGYDGNRETVNWYRWKSADDDLRGGN